MLRAWHRLHSLVFNTIPLTRSKTRSFAIWCWRLVNGGGIGLLTCNNLYLSTCLIPNFNIEVFSQRFNERHEFLFSHQSILKEGCNVRVHETFRIKFCYKQSYLQISFWREGLSLCFLETMKEPGLQSRWWRAQLAADRNRDFLEYLPLFPRVGQDWEGGPWERG